MDISRDTPTPEEVAEAIADAEPVDWQSCEASDTWKAAQIEALKQVEAVAAAFRTAAAALPQAQSQRPAQAPLFYWGSLEVVEKLGEGSFGEVFRARDPVLDRDIALKLHHPLDSRRLAARGDFIAEARRLARLRHPNVVVVHGADEHDGRTGLALDLIDGRTLAEQVAEDGPMSPGEAISVGLDLCGALAAVHGAGLVHADIKPANVMRERGGRIVLMDFGAGVDFSPDPPSGAVCGTPAVMAPEVLGGEPPSPASDIYSLGVLLYFLLSGRYPYEAESLGALIGRQQRREAVPLADCRPDLPEDLVQVIERAIDSSVDRRFASAGELRRALSRVASAPDVSGSHHLRLGRKTVFRVAAAILIGGAGLAGSAIALRGLAARSPSPGAAQPAVPPAVEASLYRHGPDGAVPIRGRQTVQPGDHLFLTIATAEPVHLYVLNEDAAGEVFVLFPVPGLDPGNPLTPRTRHRLPGELAGRSQNWVVTSAGGQERFLFIAARRSLVEIEGELSLLAAASVSRAVSFGAGDTEQVALRGVGGLTAAGGDSSHAQSMRRLRVVLAELAQHGEVWMNEVIVENPAS